MPETQAWIFGSKPNQRGPSCLKETASKGPKTLGRIGLITKKHPFSKAQRLQTPVDFQAVFTEANSQANPIRARSSYFTVLARPNDRDYARLGLVVSKRNVRRAVHRNESRRLIRESFRLHQEILAGLDVVVLVKCTLPEKPNSFFYECLEKQWKELLVLWKKG